MPPMQVGLQRRHTPMTTLHTSTPRDHTRYETGYRELDASETGTTHGLHSSTAMGGYGYQDRLRGEIHPWPESTVENMRMEKDTALSRTLPRGAW